MDEKGIIVTSNNPAVALTQPITRFTSLPAAASVQGPVPLRGEW